MIRQIDMLEPSGVSTFSVDCTYNNETGRWEPDNMEEFSAELMAAAIGM